AGTQEFCVGLAQYKPASRQHYSIPREPSIGDERFCGGSIGPDTQINVNDTSSSVKLDVRFVSVHVALANHRCEYAITLPAAHDSHRNSDGRSISRRGGPRVIRDSKQEAE